MVEIVFVPEGITVLWELGLLVMVPGFKIDREAVTYRQYLRYLVETGQPLDRSHWEVRGFFSKTIKPRYGELDDPVKNVSWDEASKYATWRRARLPRCVEWIRAVKGRRPDGWPSGNESDIDRYFEDKARAGAGLTDEVFGDVLPRHARPFDTGDLLNPAVEFARQWEWAIEPLWALRDAYEERRLAGMRLADIEIARKNDRMDDIPRIYAYYDRLKAEPGLRTDWRTSDEKPLLGFVADHANFENGMISSLSRTLSGGKIGFRCVVDG
jgi:hypothetical protein